MTTRKDCIIVGGGIGGAVLALLLAKQGRAVLILEREKIALRTGRPEILEEATFKIFDSIGVAERVRAEAALPLQGLQLTDAKGRKLFAIDAEDMRRSSVQPYSTDPYQVRQILLQTAASAGGVEVRRGAEVTGLIRSGNRIAGVKVREDGSETECESHFVVGDDGPHSRIRSSLNIQAELSEFPFKFLVPKQCLPVSDPSRRGLACFNFPAIGNGIAGGVFMPIGANQTAFIYILRDEVYRRLVEWPENFAGQTRPVTPVALAAETDRLHFLDDFVLMERPFGHAERYCAEGAAILGDAAHPVTPAGGQGANMSVADAAALAQALNVAYRTGDFELPMRRYEELRRPANARSLLFSSRVSRVFRMAQAFPPLRSLLPALITLTAPRFKTRFLRAVGTSFRSRP